MSSLKLSVPSRFVKEATDWVKISVCLALAATSSEVISFLILNLIRIESAAVNKIRLEEMQW